MVIKPIQTNSNRFQKKPVQIDPIFNRTQIIEKLIKMSKFKIHNF